MTIDYGQTIHLPKTDFPRRAGLAQKEPELLKRWEKMGLYQRQREASKGREKFILHFGPPFANGHIHLGHLLSHSLKDIVCRSYQMLGRDAPLVPGYDCHGLPIEWKVEEEFRAKGKNGTKDTDPVGFRTACRDYAAHWSDVQTGELQRIGILADWKNPYSTMHKRSEALIASEIHQFLMSGSLYRGSKPVMWSVPEQTALAEAEVEYKDITSDTVFVKFPVKKGPKELEGASVVIWTTTPWTLPGNRAIAYGEELEYRAVLVKSLSVNGSLLKEGDILLVEENRADHLCNDAGIADRDPIWRGKGSAFKGMICCHPLQGKGYEFDVPLLAGDFVTNDAGTGFVHCAPGHGEDDYRLCIKRGIAVPHTVGGDGKYFDDVPLFHGEAVIYPDGKRGKANKRVVEEIEKSANLVAVRWAGQKGEYKHSYPHSWRSKAPVIFRNTPQWFISMDKNDLRQKALAEIKKTRWVPARGENRIGSMVEGRGDWCISRQRAWGVPIALFVNKKTGEPLRDDKVNARIFEVFEKEGSDAWFNHPPQHFLGNQYDANDFEQVRDIIDVWFESGSTQRFVLERPELSWPADLYLEGSDQHRGWFQSSLLVATGTRGQAPYKAVLTHGFILDEKGYKMSKSVGNVTDPIKLAENYGADILRLWVTGSDYSEDIKFGENILKGQVDVYRRIRGTFCYLLGSLNGFDQKDTVAYKDLSDMDKWILHKLYEIDGTVRKAIEAFDFPGMMTAVHNFCARELSAFYFDICKDTLYCEAVDSMKRRGILTVLDHVFNHLVHWLSPVLCFTAEEAWLSYKGLGMDDAKESIHLRTFPVVAKEWHKPELEEKWQKILSARSAVTGALEIKRAEKVIGASLEAAPKIYVTDLGLMAVLKSIDFSEVCIISGAQLIEGEAPHDGGAVVSQVTPLSKAGIEGVRVGVIVEKAPGAKCERCWKYTTDVGSNAQHPACCARCAAVVQKQQTSAAA